jgi:hypothetical protein
MVMFRVFGRQPFPAEAGGHRRRVAVLPGMGFIRIQLPVHLPPNPLRCFQGLGFRQYVTIGATMSSSLQPSTFNLKT